MPLAGRIRLPALAGLLLAVIGGLALAGWMTGYLRLASVHPSFIPMAPATGAAFLALGLAFFALERRSRLTIAAVAGAAVAAAGVTRFAALVLHAGHKADMEAAIIRDAGLFGSVPLARMSPLTSLCLAAAGGAVAVLSLTTDRRWRSTAGLLGTAVGITGFTVLVGYAYGTPLLYGGTVIPVALPTAVGLVLSAAAAVALAGPDAAPLRPFLATGARARLLRAFLPATTGAVLVTSAAAQVLVLDFSANRALAAASSALAGAALVGAFVWRIAAPLGHAIDRAEQTLKSARADLEAAVAARTAELARINEELDAFTSSVSHDLRAPLRHMIGFAGLLEKSSREALDDKGRGYVRQIVDGGDRMSRLIEDLLTFARTAQAPLHTVHVDLDALVQEVIAEVHGDAGSRVVQWQVGTLPVVRGDRALLRHALANLIRNAVKYTGTRERATIEIGAIGGGAGEHVVCVRDNGVGFDMRYVDKLFGVFQRLHGADEFEGTGIGLANVRRIVQRHGGRTWAEGAVDRGAAFFIALPAEERSAFA